MIILARCLFIIEFHYNTLSILCVPEKKVGIFIHRGRFLVGKFKQHHCSLLTCCLYRRERTPLKIQQEWSLWMLKQGQRLPGKGVGNIILLPGTWSRRGRGGSARVSAWGWCRQGGRTEPSLRRHNETRQHLGSFEQCFLIKCVQGWTTHHMKNVEVLVEILLVHCLEEV